MTMSQLISWCQVFACGGLLWFGVGKGSGAEVPALDPGPGFALWHPSLNLRAGMGYKDNITLSSFAVQGSAFESVSAEAMLMRLPWDNWQCNIFAIGNDTRYLSRAASVNAEQNAAASAQFTWLPHRHWRTISTVDYSFINQVMDVSLNYDLPLRQQVFGHGLALKQGVRWDGDACYAEMAVSGARYFFRPPLDDYWQGGPALTMGRYYGRGTELTLTYNAAPVIYDTREQVQADGSVLSGSRLQLLGQSLELAWQQHWDKERRWRTMVRIAGERNADNGVGYFNYWQGRFAVEARYKAAQWELTVRSSIAFYDFDRQPSGAAGSPLRKRTVLQTGLRGERKLSAHWKLYAAYDYEQAISNLTVEQYQANVGSAGIEYSF